MMVLKYHVQKLMHVAIMVNKCTVIDSIIIYIIYGTIHVSDAVLRIARGCMGCGYVIMCLRLLFRVNLKTIPCGVSV